MRWLWRSVLRQVNNGFCFTGLLNGDLKTTACLPCVVVHHPSHREPKAHRCVPTVATEDRNAQAKALLAKAFPVSKKETASASPAESAPTGSVTSESSSVPNPNPNTGMPPKPKDPAKEARLRKVELMKMRHQAVPVEAQFARSGATLPPVDRRRFFKATTTSGGAGSVVAYWVTKVRARQ